ncbi:acyl carrier protein [Nocardioides flavus (ex Wang et al. 2016)]|uniref:Acyl carrier protein n=1 Tax=Nocardioides flavus (ex Wang et al. 2016) TaxID=2058780 RepID=A0ABQ3HKH3_9ACTN|nr:acyl carrier protein [Nocardioides flavus (ex Wang et al. 2016)]GHE18193.1 acyl carrier protein [Nocardioides flavus (ex Wang et al. 2016)]
MHENREHGVVNQGVMDQVRDFIVTNFLFGDDSRLPGANDSLLESGLVDSTGVLEIVDFLETDMQVAVADDETLPSNLDSIENLTSFITRKRSATAMG